MNDLISRQAAITIPILPKEHRKYQTTNLDDAYELGWCDCQECIEDLPSAQQWIPVMERLPEFDTKVLAWVENKDPEGKLNSPGVYTATLRNKIPQHDPEGKRNFWGRPGYDSEWSVWSWSYFTEPDVKAWMPLPEPYKEKNNE